MEMMLCQYYTFKEAVDYVREGNGPIFVESITYRWYGHSSSDPGKYRTREEVEEWKKKDPILKLANYIVGNKIATEEELKNIELEVKNMVDGAVKFAEESPLPPLETAFEDIYAD